MGRLMGRGGEEGQGQNGQQTLKNGQDWDIIKQWESETVTRPNEVENHCIQPLSRGRNKMNEWKRNMLQCCATHCHTGYNVRQPPNHVDTHAVLQTAHRKREHSEFMVPLKKVQRLDYPESFCQNHHKRILSILTRFNGFCGKFGPYC